MNYYESIQIEFLKLCGKKRFVGENYIFTNFSTTHEAICRCNLSRNLSPDLQTRSNLSPRRVARICRQGKFPFRKRSLSFLRQLEIFDLLLRVILLKRQKIATSNPDLSYPNLSPLPLHYHTDPPNVRKIKVYKLANCIHQLRVSLAISISRLQFRRLSF